MDCAQAFIALAMIMLPTGTRTTMSTVSVLVASIAAITTPAPAAIA
jgi:hypothetical protein